SVEPQTPASFEVSLFSGVHVPNVKVRVFSQSQPAVVVAESEGSTNVAECSVAAGCAPGAPGTDNDDTIQVKLSADPHGAKVVTLGDGGSGRLAFSQATLTFDSS